MEANEAIKAMARRIAQRGGYEEDDGVVEIIRQAIAETQRADAELAGLVVVEHCRVPTQARREIAAAIRAGEHYAAIGEDIGGGRGT